MRAPSTPRSDLTVGIVAFAFALVVPLWAGVFWFASWLIPLLIQSV